MFSYGSGLIASMFSIISVNYPKQKFNLEKIKFQLFDIEKRLNSRICFTPNEYTSILERKESLYNKGYKLLKFYLFVLKTWLPRGQKIQVIKIRNTLNI